MNSHSLHSLFTAAALIVTTGIATAANITEVKTYQSSISTDAQGALDLTMEANYNNAVSNAPLMVMLHQYSNSSELFNQVRPNAQSVRDEGFFVITVAMRGRMSSDGARDSGGLEIYDILDAVEAAKTQYGGLIDPTNINITGYSGGGGNTMSALTKFPDLFRTGGAFFGMADYGYDATHGWYNHGAAGNHQAQLDTDVGNPNNSPTALITSRYMARASNLASRNNPYSEIHLFVNSNEPTCPPINSTSYRDNAVAAASSAGEFDNITVHIGNAGTYQDFNSNGINEANEEQYWVHSTLAPTNQAAGLSWYLDRVLDGSIPAPVLNASDDLFVAGFVRTKNFSFFIGDGQNGAGSLIYNLSAGVKTFTFHQQSTYAVTGKLTVDTADMNGQTVNVVRNGVLSATFTGGGTYQVPGVADNETVRLVAAGIPGATTNEIQYLSGTDKDNTVPWDFRVSAGRNAGVWTTIPVPSCWDTKGFGSYEYGNINTTEYGDYKKTFNVPAGWAGKRVFLVFEGSMTDTEPRINGLPPGGGTVPNALSNDRALDNHASTSMGQGGGLALSGSGNLNLGTLNEFTLTCWVKPEADFSTMPDGRFPRLMLLGANANYNGDAANGAYFSVYNSGGNTRALQFKLNADFGDGVISTPNVLSGSDWTFLVVTYDSTQGSNNVKFYVGNQSGALGSPVSTATYAVGGSAQFGANAFAYLLNRSDRGRAFDGWGDDFRIFNSALTQAQLETVRASGIGTYASPPTPLYHWNFDNATTGTTVSPVTGAGGVLTLQNSAGTSADLYSPIGDGVSGGQSESGVVHQGGFYEFSYDVTSDLNFGASNLLEVNVKKVSANASVNDAERKADFWTFGGIYRPVYLEARPAMNIERVAVDAKANGQITVQSFLSGVSSPCTVAARVTDMNDVPLGTEFTVAADTNATSATLSASLPTPQPWSPEFPNLYKLIVEIRDGATVLFTRTETIGFRTIGFVANSGFTLNGKKILLRGVNRHEFWPTDGRTTSRAVSIADIELMKSMNMNAVRMSHYPPSKHFLEECDRLGLLVLDELTGWQSKYDDTIAPGLVREMVIRDVNHPSIFAWANGNEGGFNYTVDDDFALWDPQNRKVLHPPNWGSELTGGVRTHHYADYTTFLSYLGAGQPVFMPTEIQHGLYDGGGGEGLADHWNAMRAASNGGGMFLWSLLDEGLVRDDQGGAIDVAGDQAPDGIVGPYREKEASYYSVKALWSPVQITAPDPATFNGTLAVDNRFDFTNLNQCKFTWQLGWFPDPADPVEVQNTGFIVGKSGAEFAGPSVVPAASGSLALGVPASVGSYDALRVTAKDPSGREIYTWTWPLHSETQVRNRLVRVPGGATSGLTPTVNGNTLSVTNGTRVWQFNLTNGRLNGVTVAGQPVSLSNGPRPVTGTWTTTGVTHGFDGADYLVTMNDVTSASDGFQWRIQPNGWVTLKYRYTLTGAQKWLGVTFDYPEANVTGMRWLGLGPYRVWKNRMEGQEIGTHFKASNNNVNGSQWGYPEFRGYHAQLYWAQLATTQQPITLTTDTPNLFLRVLSPSLTPPNYSWRGSVSPAFPAGNLSLLHAINAIGNKFADPSATATGPGSADTIATGLYEGAVDFYFGALPDPGVDRDGNGLGDSWELQYFNTLGHDPGADSDNDSLQLELENAFDLSPLMPDVNSPRLPRPVVPGMSSPAAMAYSVPLVRLNEFNFVPEISDSMVDWFDQIAHPDYFQIETSDLSGERRFTLEHGPAWPGDTDAVFLRLRIERK